MTAKCCTCGQYSECTIQRWRRWFHITLIPLLVTDRGYEFVWKACKHELRMEDPAAVKRYKEEQVDTGMFSVASCDLLRPVHVAPRMAFNLKNLLLLSPFIIIILVGIIYICLVMIGILR